MSQEKQLQLVFEEVFQSYSPIYDQQVIDYNSRNMKIRYNLNDLTNLIDNPESTMVHKLIDINLDDVINILDSTSVMTPDSRKKPVIGLIKGVGSGKTRLLEELRRKVILQNNNTLVLAITYNHFSKPGKIEEKLLKFKFDADITYSL
jgi:hypothetical protein